MYAIPVYSSGLVGVPRPFTPPTRGAEAAPPPPERFCCCGGGGGSEAIPAPLPNPVARFSEAERWPPGDESFLGEEEAEVSRLKSDGVGVLGLEWPGPEEAEAAAAAVWWWWARSMSVSCDCCQAARCFAAFCRLLRSGFGSRASASSRESAT